jgi:hypothetical protein
MKELQRSRLSAYMAQQGLCYYCRFEMWLLSPEELTQLGYPRKHVARLQCTAEHLISRSEGGSDKPENIAAACIFCNQSRHTVREPLTPDGHRNHVRSLLAQGMWHPFRNLAHG